MQETWGLIPGLGRSPGEGNGNPLQYSCLENPMDRGARCAAVCGVTESETTEHLSTHRHREVCVLILNHTNSSSVIWTGIDVPMGWRWWGVGISNQLEAPGRRKEGRWPGLCPALAHFWSAPWNLLSFDFGWLVFCNLPGYRNEEFLLRSLDHSLAPL